MTTPLQEALAALFETPRAKPLTPGPADPAVQARHTVADAYAVGRELGASQNDVHEALADMPLIIDPFTREIEWHGWPEPGGHGGG